MKKNLFYVFLVIFIVVLAFTISIVNKNYIVGAKAYTKLLYHGSTKFSILFWRKAPQISEQKTGHVFFTERYGFVFFGKQDSRLITEKVHR